METTRHKIMDGRVQLYQRPEGPNWWWSCTIDGKQKRRSTGEESLARAKDIARDGYLTLLGKLVAGDLRATGTADSNGLENVSKFLSGELKDIGKNNRRVSGKLFSEAADEFFAEFEASTRGERNAQYVRENGRRIEVHLKPYFKGKVVNEITSGTAQEYRRHRLNEHVAVLEQIETDPTLKASTSAIKLKPPSRSTLHKELVVLRQVLAFSNRQGWLPSMPDLKSPYKASGKISRRAWFSPEEYRRLYLATRDRAHNPSTKRWKIPGQNLHDLVLLMANTGLRPDEMFRLEYRDVKVVKDSATGERILEIEINLGKRGVGFCKSMPMAVRPFLRLKKRNNGQPNDRLFPTWPRELFNTILKELGLKKDRLGQPRSLYSLRHTYISFRLMEGAEIYALSKNTRTSVEMLQTFYANHIKDLLDAAAINVLKDKDVNKSKPKGDLSRAEIVAYLREMLKEADEDGDGAPVSPQNGAPGKSYRRKLVNRSAPPSGQLS